MTDDSPKPALDSAPWHPKLKRFYDYWRRIHPPAGLPGRQHVEPAELTPLLPNMWLLDVQRRPFRLRYRLVGTRIVDLAERDLTGQWLDEAHPHSRDEPGFFADFEAVVERGQPNWRKGKPTLYLRHKDFATIERLALPLARDGTEVDVIMACTVFHSPDGSVI
jgi:hypothetical protein